MFPKQVKKRERQEDKDYLTHKHLNHKVGSKTEHMNTTPDKKGKAAEKAEKEVRRREEEFIPYLLPRNPKRRDVSEREPVLVGPHEDPAILPKNHAEMEAPKKVQNRSGPNEDVTKMINHEQDVAEMVADENWTDIRNLEEDVSEERSEFPVISIDALRPRNDPLWDSAD